MWKKNQYYKTKVFFFFWEKESIIIQSVKLKKMKLRFVENFLMPFLVKNWDEKEKYWWVKVKITILKRRNLKIKSQNLEIKSKFQAGKSKNLWEKWTFFANSWLLFIKQTNNRVFFYFLTGRKPGEEVGDLGWGDFVLGGQCHPVTPCSPAPVCLAVRSKTQRQEALTPQKRWRTQTLPLTGAESH